jgi:ribokinase
MSEPPRIAVIGLTGDTVFMGVSRFHTGGETVHAADFHREFGGKGFNQAVAAARQGACVSLLTAIGAEDEDRLRRFLRSEGIDGLLAVRDVPSAHATILTDGTGETRVTVFPGAALEASDVDRFAEKIGSADILLLNNEVPEPVNLRAAEIARARGVKIVFNPAPARPLPDLLLSATYLFTPNEFEEASVASAPGEVVTTLGAAGCRIRSTGGMIGAEDCGKPVDSTGAGDTFTAVLAVRIAEGAGLADACRAANEAAGKSVTVRYVLPSIPYRGSSGVRAKSGVMV